MALPKEREWIYSELARRVGKTPLTCFELPNGCKLYCKEEWQNPTGSHYDRVFPHLLRKLEDGGRIIPRTTELVDATTGNAGAALAYCAQRLAQVCTIFIPEDMPRMRLRQIESYGARLSLSPSGQYVAGAVSKLRKYLVAARLAKIDVVCVEHSRNPVAVEAFAPIAEEIISELPSNQKLDFLVGAIGNGLTFAGLVPRLRSKFPNIKIIGIEPVDAPSNFVRKYPGRFEEVYGQKPHFLNHRLLGAGGWKIKFPFIDLGFFDEVRLVADDGWFSGCTWLRKAAHRSVGRTSGACAHVINQLASREPKKTFFQLLYDPDWKYCDHPDGDASKDEIPYGPTNHNNQP